MLPHQSLRTVYKEKYGKSVFKYWMCNLCNMVGTWEQLENNPCDYQHKVCKYCGKIVECAWNCEGIKKAFELASIDINT